MENNYNSNINAQFNNLEGNPNNDDNHLMGDNINENLINADYK